MKNTFSYLFGIEIIALFWDLRVKTFFAFAERSVWVKKTSISLLVPMGKYFYPPQFVTETVSPRWGLESSRFRILRLIWLFWADFYCFFVRLTPQSSFPYNIPCSHLAKFFKTKLKIAKNRTEFMKKSKICVFQRFWGGGTGTPLQWSLAGVGRHGFQSKNRLLWLFSMVWGLSLLTQFRKAIFGYFKVFFKLLAMWSKV